MKNVSDKSCGENQTTRFVFKAFSKNRDLYEIKWKNILEPDGP
jgi:hypothetical protein